LSKEIKDFYPVLFYPVIKPKQFSQA
jgi:hypothetical protein